MPVLSHPVITITITITAIKTITIIINHPNNLLNTPNSETIITLTITIVINRWVSSPIVLLAIVIVSTIKIVRIITLSIRHWLIFSIHKLYNKSSITS